MVTKRIFHEMCNFHSQTSDGNVAYNQSTELDKEEKWVYAKENGGYTLFFSVHRVDGAITEITGRRLEWIRRFLAMHDVEYVNTTPEQVADAVDERVEIVEEPLDVTPLKTSCSGCGADYLVDVLPKMDLKIDGLRAQRVIEEYCPKCETPMVHKATCESKAPYSLDLAGFDPADFDDSDVNIWEHARRYRE